MTVRWGTRSETRPALLEAAGHATTAFLVAVLLMCLLGMAVAL